MDSNRSYRKGEQQNMSEQTVNISIAVLFFVVLGIVKNRFGMG